MPDGIIAIGPSSAKHAVDGGYPAGRVAVCGPQRYGNLVAYRRARPSRKALRQRLGLPTDRLVILVALAIIETDTEALCAALAIVSAAFGDVLLIVRMHPNQPRAKHALDVMLSDLGETRARIMPSTATLYDFLAAADLMMCIGSMVAFEAMALDVMPIVFENPSTFAATSLAEYEAGLFVARNGRELVEATEAVRVNSARARGKRLMWPSILKDVFGDLDRPLEVQMDEAIASIVGVRATSAGAQISAEGPSR